jgi:ADP-ribosyl-[dinitrogen reductase] hydrolase
MKTSHTHPLQINSVSATGGQIGLTFCPGKKQAHSVGGPWDRDLNVDLEAIKEWGAVGLVTLIEDHEFEELVVPELGTETENQGMEWYHLPIRDVSIPNEQFEANWAYAGHRLRALLLNGKKIVLHCKGGLGRTGTIAARLLVELGNEPGVAIDAVRAARPGAIETTSQEDYVRRCKAVPANSDYADAVLGCLLGGAVGDGFGYEVEFKSLSTIRQLYGDAGICAPVFQDGNLVVSDDTQMTLFTLEGLLRTSDFDETLGLEQIRLAYLDWLSTQTSPTPDWSPAGSIYKNEALTVGRAPGNTCLSALRVGGHGTPDNQINDSKGCGGVMRVAPIGLIRDWSPRQAFDVAAKAAAITHGHPSGFWSAGAMAAMIAMVIDGIDLRDAAIGSLNMLIDCAESAETIDAVNAALKASLSGRGDHTIVVKELGQGWVGEEALAVGLYASLVGSSFAEVLSIAANHSGDSDSTASIAGQLYGAWKGQTELPLAWTRRLDVFKPMMGLIQGLFETSAGKISIT